MIQDQTKPKERVLLVAAQKKQLPEQEAWESLEELEELAKTAGAEVIMKILQRVDSIQAGLYIGSGKVEEIKELIKIHELTGVMFDDELTPIQMRNLSEALDIKVMDRTMVILDIFAGRARSKEGQLQVEMAQLKYQSSRLVGFGAMLSRQGGGIGSRGPGEKKLELDKRHIHKRLEILKEELAEVEKHRTLIRKRRAKNSEPIVALVGYTNAGKSTLLNQLSGSNVYAEDQLFATLDPTTRSTCLPSGSQILLTDTVGFIRKLPHHLIKAFYSTLEEAKYADIILHVMDASSPYLKTHQEVVYETLQRLKIEGVPIVAVYNKIDKTQESYPKDEQADYEVAISAKTGTDCDQLLDIIEKILYSKMQAFKVLIPYERQDIVTFCHTYGERLELQYENDGTQIEGYMPHDKFYKIEPYLNEFNDEK